jgi:acetolactate synthase II small subunit
MNTHFVSVKTKLQPATLEQLLRVVRFRGFAIEKMTVATVAAEQEMQIDMSVRSSRSVHLLESQLMKLVDVKQVLVENGDG